MAGPTSSFNAQSGFCNQNGRIALEKNAPAGVLERVTLDSLLGAPELTEFAETNPKLPVCKNPGFVSQLPNKAPGR